MKRMKQFMSWLLVFAMMISLMPVNLVRAEGEDSTEEVTKYSVYVSPYVYMVSTYPSEEYNSGFSVTVPEGQTGVEVDTENYWYVEEGNTFTIQVTIPEDCEYNTLLLCNYAEEMEGVSFEKVADTDNTYSVTVSPTESMDLQVYDGTYFSVCTDCITTNFNCYIASDATATSESTISYVKVGDSYVICLDTALGSISDESLSLSINDTAITVDQLGKRDAGWYYTVNNVTSAQNVKVYETGTNLTVTMPDLSFYGYEIYDATGNDKIDWENGPTTYEVQSGSDLTFQVKQIIGVEETLPFGLYWGNDELTSEDGTTYTIPAVTWNASVDAYRKYLVSVAEDSDMKFFPCTSDGTLLTNTSVSEYYYRECAAGYFKLDGNYSEYEVSDDTGVITPDSNGVYSVSVDTFDKTLTITDVPKYKLSISGADIKMIPCTETGEVLGEATSELEYAAYTYAYFKLEDADFKYNIKNGTDTIIADDNGVYYVWMEEAPVELTVVPCYYVSLTGMSGCSLNVGSEDVCYDSVYDEDTEITYYIVEDEMFFEVVVYSDYNADNMTVTLKNEDGTTDTLTSTGSSINEDGDTVYSFVADSITQDAEIIVEGIYSTYTNNLILHYSASDMRDLGLTIDVLDENGDVLEQEDWNPDETKVDVHEGLKYTLSISGEESALETLKVTADGQPLSGNIEDGVWTAEVVNIYDIYIVSGNQYYISYACDDEVGNIYIAQYGLDYFTPMQGYYPAGEISFWIQEDSDGVTAENASVVSIKDNNGNDVEYTTRENVEVDDYGKKRTLYTVDLDTDITITIAGAQRLKYDVYLPIADDSDGYTISKLYTKEEVEDEEGDWVEQEVYLTGTDIAEDACTKYGEIDWDTIVYFDITTGTSNGTPYVQLASGGVMTPYAQEEVDESTTKYTYRFYVERMTEVSVSVNTADIQVEAIGDQQYYVRYEEDFESWRIYDMDPDASAEMPDCIIEIYGLPLVADMNDTDYQHKVYFDVYGDNMIDMDYNSDLFLSAEKEDGTQKALSLQYGTMPGEEYYIMPISDGYTKLILDMTKLEQRNGKVTLISCRDDMKIAIAGEEGTDYTVVTSKDDTYKANNHQIKFSVTADDAADFEKEDFFLGVYGYEMASDYEESADGKTRTYTILNAIWDSTIHVSYPATVAFEECETGGIYTNVMGEGAGHDEYGNFDPGTFAAGTELMLNFYVESGYDVESVKVIQKYVDEEGNEQITEYTDFDDYAWQDDRVCNVILQPGLNTFSVEEAKAKIYTMSLPTSAAYTIELVNGSKTTVDYKGTFSFKVKANEGYDLSNIVVTANGQKMTPDANGVYTIKNVSEDYDIGITGYKTRNYIVTFKDYDGKVLKTQTVEHGKAATAPANPTRKGYSFTGWNTTFTKVTKDMTVTATYKPILVTKLKITGDYKNLAVGKTVKLTATATPTDALNKNVVWSTSNKKYATVSSTGKVKALKKGAGKTVTITATAKDGSGVKATYKIKIYKNPIKKIKLTAKTKTVKAGKKVTVKATLTPSKSICKTLKWTSSNTKWATVNAKGVVTTKKAGKGKTVKITAQAMDGSNKKAIIKIKIKK